jgi:hypothetical protein
MSENGWTTGNDGLHDASERAAEVLKAERTALREG